MKIKIVLFTLAILFTLSCEQKKYTMCECQNVLKNPENVGNDEIEGCIDYIGERYEEYHQARGEEQTTLFEKIKKDRCE